MIKETLLIISASFFLVFAFGCEPKADPNGPKLLAGPIQQKCLFAPSEIKLNHLTEFVSGSKISVYVDMHDQFGSRIKASGLWQFELYAYVPRSADSRGSRLYLSDQISLADAAVNDAHWQDYLRCYKIDIELKNPVSSGKTYILEASCLTAEGRRLSDSMELKL